MISFALVAEGMTDLATIERIVAGAIGDDAVVNPLMPLRDATDRSRAKDETFSSWELVLEYASSEQTFVALETNDFLIIQIDTDQADHPKFGLNLHNGGNLKPIEAIVEECRNLILQKLPRSIPNEWHRRIIFAIPVLSTECWLIPVFDGAYKHSTKTTNNCENRLSALIKRVVKKEYDFYLTAAKPFSKSKKLENFATRTPCLKHFVDQLKKAKLEYVED